MKKKTSNELDKLFKKANNCRKKKKCDDCGISDFMRCLYKFKAKNPPVVTNLAEVESQVDCKETCWMGDDCWTRGWISLSECKKCGSHLGMENGKVKCGYDERLDEWTCKNRGRFW